MRARNVGVIVAVALGAMLLFGVSVAQDLHWTPAPGWTNADNAAQTGSFSPAEMGAMTFYIRINKPTPKDNTGSTGFNRPGTWYYAGEVRNGGTRWPGDNNIEGILQAIGYAGQSVSFTVSQAHKSTDGVERDSQLSEVLTWNVPVPFVPKIAGEPLAPSIH